MESVRQRINSGDFQPGDRIPSDSELVREFGVSRPTVAKALQDLERKGLVKRKTGSGTFVLQSPAGEGLSFGLLIPGLGTTEIFEPICSEMARIAQQNGHSILWGCHMASRGASDVGSNALEQCRTYIERKVGGVFFAPIEHSTDKDAINQRVLESFQAARIPVVLLDRDCVAYPDRSPHDLVGIDNRRVGYVVTHHMFQRGCQRVVFLARPSSAATIDARIAGFTEAVVKDSGSFSDSLIIRCDPSDRATVKKFVGELRPDAIVCGNDVTAGHLMHCLEELGVRVPDDVLIAGIDDVRYAELLRVPLTTVRQPCIAIGDAAFRAMLDRIANPESPPRDILLGADLVVRASTTRTKVASQ